MDALKESLGEIGLDKKRLPKDDVIVVSPEIHPDDCTTSDYLSELEHADVLGVRVSQIEAGVPTTLSAEYMKKHRLHKSEDIVDHEMLNGVMPFIIVRTHLNGSVEKIKVSTAAMVTGPRRT